MLGPLGNTFEIADNPEPAILVGGGAGIASLMLLAVALRARGIETITLVGAQHHRRLLSVDDLEAIGVSVHIATDDGSVGHHGVCYRHPDRHAPRKMTYNIQQSTHADHTECLPLSRRLQQNLKSRLKLLWKIEWDVHWGCVLDAFVPFVLMQIGSNINVSCTEGPVFDATDIAWDI